MKLNHVLSRTEPVEISLHQCDAQRLAKAARFWLGKETGNLKRDAALAALNKTFADPQAGAALFARLNETDRQVLSIFARYGTTMSGDLLKVELVAHGVVDPPTPDEQRFRSWQRDGIVQRLQARLLLITEGGPGYYSSYHYGETFPELTLHPALVKCVPPAPPVPWKPSITPSEVKSTMKRSSAEVALDLWHVAEALNEMTSWQLVQGDMLSKGSRNKLQKLVAMTSAEQDPLAPPDPQALYYEVLHQMSCLDFRKHALNVAILEKASRLPPAAQAWFWVRAWLDMALWQDGLGVVPDRDDRDGSVRIPPANLFRAKTLLVWSLCRVAASNVDWLDLEDFLRRFWLATRNDFGSFYWGGYSWDPDFKRVRVRDESLKDDQRIFSYWLAKEGTWAANAMMVTLVALGLVERGHSAGERAGHCFRLTDVGRIVFGAPESEVPREIANARFLTVQPNHEILAYLDTADSSQVSLLTRFTDRTSGAGGRVQMFAMRRETVYRGLESGLTSESIRQFLADQSRTPVPENVIRSLSEWSGKRESLVLRQHVTLALTPDGSHLPEAHAPARALGPACVILPAMSSNQAQVKFPDWKVFDHAAPFPATARVDERGVIHIERIDSVARILLSRIAELSGEGWQITRPSVARARQLGMNFEQILVELRLHLAHDIPPLLSTAIQNWAGRAPAVYVGKVLMLQVPRPDACQAILTSKAFEPLMTGYLPPNWFFIRDDKAAETKRLLRDLGFSLSDSQQPDGAEGANNSAPEQKPQRKKRVRSL
jgi:hypothetical protein